MLFNEPKLLKCAAELADDAPPLRFSALQRAEIAERCIPLPTRFKTKRFSALQRAEIAEIWIESISPAKVYSFSALQRAEIAEIHCRLPSATESVRVSVLFNEPKLLKFALCCVHRIRHIAVSVLFNEPKLLKCVLCHVSHAVRRGCFSALQRAEIAEITAQS